MHLALRASTVEVPVKRFFLMTVLLLALLLVARATQAGDDANTLGRTTNHDIFFDHGFRADEHDGWGMSRIRRSLDAPRRVGDVIRFRLRDRDYESAWIEISSNDWERVPMQFDYGNDRWTIELELPRGRHRYVFVVEDADGDRRVRTDAANRRRRRDRERDWVSEIEIDRDGDLVEDRRYDRAPRRRHRDDRANLDLLDEVVVRYQRVDGFVLGFRPVAYTHDAWSPRLDGEFLYGFSSDRWSSRLSLLQPISPGGTLRVHASVYDRTDTIDRTGVGPGENSVATLVFREDAYDWFRREGLSLGVEAEFHHRILGRFEFRSDEYSSLDRTVIAGWGGREDFLPNPAIDEGLIRSLFTRMRLGTDLDHLWIEFETSDDGFAPTDLEFTRLEAQYRGRLRLGYASRLDVRLRYGTTLAGTLPIQKRFVAGGIGTVRGYRYQSLGVGDGSATGYGGEQMLLANAEYVLGADDHGFAAAIFVDAGQVWFTRDDDLDLNDLVSSVGVGILFDGEDDALRIDLARPLEGDGDLMVQLRLNRTF